MDVQVGPKTRALLQQDLLLLRAHVWRLATLVLEPNADVVLLSPLAIDEALIEVRAVPLIVTHRLLKDQHSKHTPPSVDASSCRTCCLPGSVAGSLVRSTPLVRVMVKFTVKFAVFKGLAVRRV